MPEFPVANGFYEDASKPIASQECVNWIPQVPQADALSPAQLIGTAGIEQFTTTGVTPSLGRHVMNGIPYVITRDALFRINTDGTVTNLGVIESTETVSTADNGTQLCIVVPKGKGYIYTVSGGLVEITDINYTTTLGPSEQVVFIDGYFMHFNNSASVSTGKIIFNSNLNDGLTYNALDFGTAEADPDEITGIHVSRSQLYVGGGQTIEPFSNIGGADFPFQRISGAVVPKGVKAKFSLIEYDDSFVFIGGGVNEKPAVWKFTGSSGQKISTAAIDLVIQNLTDEQQKEIFCTTFGEYGAFFLNVHIRDRVFTFDSMATALSGQPKWHERKSKDRFGNNASWRVNGIMFAYGVTLVTDNQDGRIGVMDRDIYTEYGEIVTRIFSTIPFQAQGEAVTVSEMELTCESGVGIGEKRKFVFPYTFPFPLGSPILADGLNPRIIRSYSDDGGFTFGNETSRSLGKRGEYNKRQIWRQEGQLRRYRVYKFILSEPVKPVIIKLEADLILDAS